MKKWLWRGGVLLGAGLLAAGLVLAVDGYGATGGPADVARGYFAALARSDAPDALAYGDVPDGPHTLLTSTVLGVQNRIAPMQDVRVGATNQAGGKASVAVTYTLAFPGAPQTIKAQVPLHEQDGGWRLDAVAIRTQLIVDHAAQRVSVAGGPVPSGSVLLFPGAVPVGFDTPYLALSPADDHVDFGAASPTTVVVQVSAAGRRAVDAAVLAKLRHCLAVADPVCPLPSERYVPGSVRGTLPASALSRLSVMVGDDPSGQLDIAGGVPIEASAYRWLTFGNVARSGHGTLTLQVSASAYPVAPLNVVWTEP